MAREARKQKTKKRGLQIGIGVPLLIVLVFVLVRLVGSDSTSTITGTTVAAGVESSTSPSTDTSSTDTSSTDASSTDASSTDASSTTATGSASTEGCPAEDGSSATVSSFPVAPEMCIDATKTYTVTVETSLGSYTAELDAAKAPKTVNNFVYLARYHYFDNTPCHRVITGFVVQCGDPTGTGSGDPGYSFPDELPAAGEYKLGSLAMANSGADTNGSQFFVISGDSGIALPPKYSLFGQVTSGLDVVAKLDAAGSASGIPTTAVTITKVTVTQS